MSGCARRSRISAPGSTPTAATGSTPTATEPPSRAPTASSSSSHPAQLGQHAAGEADDDDTGLGRPHAAGMPLEQRGAGDLLEFPQAAGQRRLAEAERGGRLEQAAMGVERVRDAKHRQLQPLVEESSGHVAA